MSLFALRGVGHVNTHLEYGMGIFYVGGWGFTGIGECRTDFSVTPVVRLQRWTGGPNGSIDWLHLTGVPHLTWQIVTDGKAPLMALASGNLREGDD